MDKKNSKDPANWTKELENAFLMLDIERLDLVIEERLTGLGYVERL